MGSPLADYYSEVKTGPIENHSVCSLLVRVFFSFSVSSSVSQTFLQPVLESFMNSELQVRLAALQAIILILRQGLVHPAQVQCTCNMPLINLVYVTQ